MRHLEQLLAKVSLATVRQIDQLWQPCTSCGSLRWRFHHHPRVELYAVRAALPCVPRQGVRRGGDDVA